MGIIIDLILIAIILISAFLGYKKGLVKLAAKLFAGIIAIVFTLILYKPISGAIIENTPIVEKIKNIVIENTANFSEENNEKQDDISKQITNQVKNELIPNESENISKSIVYAVTSIVLFILVKIILSIVISLIDGIAKLPIIKQFNEVGGIIYGLARGILIVCILVLLCGVYIKMKPETNLNNSIQNSYATKILYQRIVTFSKI